MNKPSSQHHESLHGKKTRKQENVRDFADVIATFLDSAFSIPGTSIRIGLDPLLGLIPGIGDYLSNLIGSSLLFLASRSGVPKVVIFRMALNIFLNMVLGAIPGIGDLFSFWFKSNVRNAQLLHRHSQIQSPTSTTTDWAYVIAIITGMFALLTILLISITWALNEIWQYFSQSQS